MATGAGNEQAVTYEILRMLYLSTARVMELEDGFIF
jgi:hypothetical protein